MMETKLNIPLFDLNFDEKEEEAVIATLRSKWISTGPRNLEFEKMFADMIGVKYSLALSNCTSALHLAMLTLNIQEGDEVICPSLTFVATVNAIKFVGATPVFCDIKSMVNPTIDPYEIEKLVSDKTKAIMVMHYGGFPCMMNEIADLCDSYKLKLVEDACHSPLSQYQGNMLGTKSDMACYSFFSNKNISTGEGGMLVTNNEEYFKRAKLLRSHGMTSLSYERSNGHATMYDVVDLGYNYRLDDIRASIGIAQLSKLKADLDKRQALRSYYLTKLNSFDELIIPFDKHDEFCSNYIFPVVLRKGLKLKRDQIRKLLSNSGIQTSIHYPAVHLFRIYNEYQSYLPNTEYFSANEITLPLYSNLSYEEIDYICECLRNILNEAK